MNKIKRDYCNKNSHPNWKSWVPVYSENGPPVYGTSWVKNVCEYCGSLVVGIASGAPDKNERKRRAIFRGQLPSITIPCR